MSPLQGLFGPPNVEELKAKRDVKGLIAALHYDQDADVCQAAAEALGQIGDARAVMPLMTNLEETDGVVREAAAKALVKIGAPAVEPLIAALKAEDMDVRVAAAQALGQIGDARTTELLADALWDSREYVREAAAQALHMIDGSDAILSPVHQAVLKQNSDVIAQAVSVGIEKATESMNSQPTSTQGTTIYCSACGHPNPAWRLECEKCKTELVSPDKPAYTSSRERPGCVTAYAVLLGMGAGLIAIWGIIAGIGMMSYRYGNGAAGLVIIVVAGVVAGLDFLLARGLWQLKNWARIIVIVIQGLGVLGSLLSMCASLADSGYRSDPITTMWETVGGSAIGGYVMYWFASHREYFH